MEESEQAELQPPETFFPLKTMRDKQVKALDFIKRKHAEGCRNIVIAAPTGSGKTPLGVAACFWGTQEVVEESVEGGGYYLVTQKLLQDQLAKDIPKFQPHLRSCCSIKSASEYTCPVYTTCFIGRRMRGSERCPELLAGNCTYSKEKALWLNSTVALTNYPYYFNEVIYTQDVQKRRVLILDECHSLERQILNFVEIVLNSEIIYEFCPNVRPIPQMPDLETFCDFVTDRVLPACETTLDDLHAELKNNKALKIQQQYAKLESWINRTKAATEDARNNPDNWVYWQEQKEKDLESIAKPLSAAPFYKELIEDTACIRIFMSAYPGPMRVFCRSLGLEEHSVRWLNLASTFPIDNRPIHLLFIGSMGQKNIAITFPAVQRMCERIIKAHADEKGLIHVHSYKLGDALFKFLSTTPVGSRLLYPRSAKERDILFQKHARSPLPTVLISPSMAEGFDMIDGLARWQIIVKTPYPYLGDKQVEAKKNRDPDWYSMQTIMTVIQACGRIVRSDTDHGVTYILDRDFMNLYDQHRDFFPHWFTESFIWHNQ